MRRWLLKHVVSLACWLHDEDVKVEFVPADKFDTLSRLHMLVDKINGTMHQIPRKYYLWTDWTSKPAKLIVCEHTRGERERIYPKKETAQ